MLGKNYLYKNHMQVCTQYTIFSCKTDVECTKLEQRQSRQKLKFKIPEVYFIVATLSAEIKKTKKKSIFHTKQKHISQELSLNGWVSGLGGFQGWS